MTSDEIEVLDGFLQYEFYHDAYEELIDEDGNYFELFEPLEFCQVFSQAVEMIEQNKARPLTVAAHLKNEITLVNGEKPLNDKQRYFFYKKILTWFSDLRRTDKQIDICCREISKLQESLDVYAEDEALETSEQRDAFKELLEHLETLPDYKAKIAYLIQQKTEYEQNTSGPNLNWNNEKTFGEKCQLEIDKLEKLRQLEVDGIKKHKDLTIDRAILLMKHLAPRLTGCDQNKVAKMIAFLTGFDFEATRQGYSKIKNKFINTPKAYNDDVKIVCKYLDLIGLTDEAKKLKAESGVT